MSQFQKRYALLFWFGAGILISTILVNRLFSSGLVNYDILYQYIRQGWNSTEGNMSWRAFRILLVRILETAAIWFIVKRTGRRIAVLLLLFIAGTGAGVSIVLMTWSCGVMGLPICLLTWLPHYLCYILAWGTIILPVYYGYEVRSSRYWSVVVGFVAIGMVGEIIINPWLLNLL
ncbi:MAG: hypothetical protein ACRDBO_14925 [Lachnospiraceae bacterium]